MSVTEGVQGSRSVVAPVACGTESWRQSVPVEWEFALDVEAVTARHGMVVSTDAYASEVGAEILRSGGNAFDAAIATACAVAVVNPEAGNIGGGGFMVARHTDGSASALNFRERAPYLVNLIDYEMTLVEAVRVPRIHHQHLPDRIQYERWAMSAETIATLESLGHAVQERHNPESLYPYIGDIQAILIRSDGVLEGVSDPRRGGAAVGH